MQETIKIHIQPIINIFAF